MLSRVKSLGQNLGGLVCSIHIKFTFSFHQLNISIVDPLCLLTHDGRPFLEQEFITSSSAFALWDGLRFGTVVLALTVFGLDLESSGLFTAN